MRTKFKLLAMLAILLATFVAVPSCKDDDDKDNNTTNNNDDKGGDNNGETTKPTEINIDAKTIANGIDVSADTKTHELSVTANGKWAAAIDADCNWAALGDRDLEYDGNKTITINLDKNLSSSTRSTTIYIDKDGSDEIIEIKVSQRGREDNGSGVAFSGKGLGHGCDYEYVLNTKENKKRRVTQDAKIAAKEMKEEDKEKFEPTKIFKPNCLFNLEKIEQLIQAGELEYNAYVEAPIEIADLQVSLLDSCVMQDKELNGNMKVSVGFGFLQLEASAEFQSQKREDRAKVDYFIERNAPMYHAYVSDAVIRLYAEEISYEEMKDLEAEYKKIDDKILYFKTMNAKDPSKKGDSTLNKGQQKAIDAMIKKVGKPEYGGVFGIGFADLYYKLYQAVSNEEYERADKILAQLDDDYGPFYISGGNWGGSLCFHMQVDTLAMKGKTSVGASLNADIMSMVSVEGEVHYTEEGATLFHNMKLNVQGYGGDANVTADRVTALMTSPSPTNYQEIQDIVKAWITSMKSTDIQDSHAMPITFSASPIWNLFADEDTHDYARNYFLKQYEKKGIKSYLNIIDGDDVNIEDMLNDNL